MLIWKKNCLQWFVISTGKNNCSGLEPNLNRIFWKRESESDEHRVAKLIEFYIQRTNFVLDLHSTHTPDKPFVFLESPHIEAKQFIESSPFTNILLDWEQLYWQTNDMDTIAYATSQGIPGVTIECGQHRDPLSIENATSAIQHTLCYFGHIPDKLSIMGWKNLEKRYVSVKEIVYRPEKARFVRAWSNFDKIQEWDLIWESVQWEYRAPYDGYIIIPKPEWTPWEEWYYLWK